MATSISLQPSCPLGISMATGGMEGLLKLGGCACVDWKEWVAGEDRASPPPRCAQPQSTQTWPTSPGAAHLPASPPVRSPARWGSMAGSPLLRGPRAGGVGLLVLLLLGMLRPPPGLCARLVKVRTRVGHRVGGGERIYFSLLGPSSQDVQKQRPRWPGIQPAVRAQAIPSPPGTGWVSVWGGGSVLGSTSSRALPIPLCPAPVALSVGLACIKEAGARVGVCERMM